MLTNPSQPLTVLRVYRAHPDAPDDEPVLLWPDPRQGPWRIRLVWAPVRGRIECVGMEIRGYRKTNEEWPPELPAWDEDPPILQTSILRDMPLHSIVGDVRREMAEQGEGFRAWLAAQPEFADPEAQEGFRQLAAFWHELPGSVSGLAEVARVYDEAWRAGKPPTKAVAEHFVISDSAAAKRVSRARKAGLLPETTRGRPSGLRRDLRSQDGEQTP